MKPFATVTSHNDPVEKAKNENKNCLLKAG